MKTAPALALAMVALAPWPAQAFYESETLELTGSARVNAGGGRLATIDGVPAPFAERTFDTSGGILRLIGSLSLGKVSVEAHVFQLLSGASSAVLLTGGGGGGFDVTEAGRFAGLTWRWYHRGGTSAELAVDRLNLRVDLGALVLTIGRQPINLATTYYFTPNDFFQAFSATTFFRVYKPGVDAIRAELQLGDLTQLTLLGVLGFDRALGSDPAVDDPPSFTASSFIGRFATTLLDVEWSILGGKIPAYWVIGGGLQGELFEWLGVRAEGHYGFAERDQDKNRAELAFGLEHRFESTLHLRLEQLYHGSGSTDPADYLATPIDPNLATGPLYLGRHYTALGAGYEVTPLLTADALALVNWTDRSFSLSLYLVYSLLDEVEVSFLLSVPVGPHPELLDAATETIRLRSEQGAYPITALAELRAYF